MILAHVDAADTDAGAAAIGAWAPCMTATCERDASDAGCDQLSLKLTLFKVKARVLLGGYCCSP